MKRTWVKLFCNQWLNGSARNDPLEVRALWVDLLAIAGEFGGDGRVRITENLPFSDENMAKMMRVKPFVWRKVKAYLIQNERIIVDSDGFLTITKWAAYQSEYQRTKGAPSRKSTPASTANSTANSTPLEGEVEVKALEGDREESKDKTPPTPLSAKKPLKVCAYSQDFLDFWKIHPRRQEKGSAWRAWNARLKEGATPDQLILAARHYALFVAGKDQAVMKLPATLLGPGQGPGGADPIWQEWQEPRANGDGRKEESKHERPKGDYGFRPYGYGTDASDYEK
jgi:hypothetical protein